MVTTTYSMINLTIFITNFIFDFDINPCHFDKTFASSNREAFIFCLQSVAVMQNLVHSIDNFALGNCPVVILKSNKNKI